MAARPRESMPEDVRAALSSAGVKDDYAARPAHQRNDYLRWLKSAKSDATRKRRLDKMLSELKRGGVYMGMKHAPSAKG